MSKKRHQSSPVDQANPRLKNQKQSSRVVIFLLPGYFFSPNFRIVVAAAVMK